MIGTPRFISVRNRKIVPIAKDKCAAFRRLHESGCFVVPNPWDAGSARYLQSLGFKALSTTGSTAAWADGEPDGTGRLDRMLTVSRRIIDACDIPVTVDFEGGYAQDPAEVARNVTGVLETGLAGMSIEDWSGDEDKPLADLPDALARLKAARAAIDRSGSGAFLTARTECFPLGHPDPLPEALRRVAAFAAAGADCVYVPGITTEEQIRAVVRAAGRTPVTLAITKATRFTVASVAALGVRRISLGAALARAAWGEFMRAAQEIAGAGTFDALERAVPFGELDGFFREDLARRKRSAG